MKERSKKQGLPPGTPVYVGKPPSGPVRITVFDYDADHLVEQPVDSVGQCLPLKDTETVTWINVDGVHDVGVVQALGEGFGLHPLVQEDILNTDQRAKAEDYGEYVYVVLKMLQWDEAAQEVAIEQVSLILGRNYVISFQEQREGDVFETVRARLRSGKGRIRRMGADYLAYCLLDAIVDGYFFVLEKLGAQLEDIEDQTIQRPSTQSLQEIYRLKREGLFLRRAVWPARELVAALERTESPLLGDGIRQYLRDVYDHVVQAIDTTETFREMLSGLLDTYLSSVGNRMNGVVKTLTTMATIFIPLTFLASLYGMNFQFMPGLASPWGCPIMLAVMATVTGSMVVLFKKKKWL
jgi:magnesium transporter